MEQPEEDPALVAARAERIRRLSMPGTDPAHDRLTGGTIKLSAAADELVLADPDGRQLLFVPLEGGGAPTTLKLPGVPHHLVVSKDEDVLVTLPWDGLLVRVRRPSGEAPEIVDRPMRAGVAPWDVAIHPTSDPPRAFVTDAGIGQLVVVDLDAWGMAAPVPLAAQPRAVALHPTGRLAVVTHLNGGDLSVLKVDHGLPERANRSALSAHAAQPGIQPAVGWIEPTRALSVVPSHSGHRWYVPHLALDVDAAGTGSGPSGGLARFARPDAPPAAPTMTVLRSGNGRPMETLEGYCGKPCDWEPFPAAEVALQDIEGLDPRLSLGSQDAVAVAHVEQEKVVLVAMRGTDDVVIYDDTNDHVPFAPIGRIAAGCAQPEGLAVARDGGSVWIHCPTDDRVTKVDIQFVREKLSDASKRVLGPVQDLPLPRSSADPALLLGRRLFRSAGSQLSRGGRLSCSTCHPEGGSDGVVWPLPEGVRNTPTLARTLSGTGPFGWRGSALTLRGMVESSVSRMDGAGLMAEQLDALTAYVDTGIPDPPGELLTEELLKQRTLGAAIFRGDGQRCATCHPPPFFTDGRAHDVLGDGEEFLTPSLLGLRRSGPYMHDGRYADLRTLIQLTGGRHGRTSALGEEHIQALIAFIRAL